MPDTQHIAEVLLENLYDINHPVNQVGTSIQGIVIRERWNRRATVRVVDHPYDGPEHPALFVSDKLHTSWRLAHAKLGTAIVRDGEGGDVTGIDIVIPGSEYIEPEPPIPPPAGFNVSTTTHENQRLVWQGTGVDYTGYHLDRLIVGTDSDYVRIATLPSGILTYFVQNLPADTMILYRIRRYSSSQTSGWSLTQRETDSAPVETLPPVQAGAITNTDIGEQELTWVYSEEENYEGFQIEKLEQGIDSDYQPLATVPAGTRSYSVDGLPDETPIWYRIRSGNTETEAISEWAVGSETTLPPVVTNPPRWNYLFDIDVQEEALPATVDISYAVVSELPLHTWVMDNDDDDILMNQDGSITIMSAFSGSINSSFTVSNDDGSATSRTITIEVHEAEVPIRYEPQYTDSFQRPDNPVIQGPEWEGVIWAASPYIRDYQLTVGLPIEGPDYWAMMNTDLSPNQYVMGELSLLPSGTNNSTLMIRGQGLGYVNAYMMIVSEGLLGVAVMIGGSEITPIALEEVTHRVSHVSFFDSNT